MYVFSYFVVFHRTEIAPPIEIISQGNTGTAYIDLLIPSLLMTKGHMDGARPSLSMSHHDMHLLRDIDSRIYLVYYHQ